MLLFVLFCFSLAGKMKSGEGDGSRECVTEVNELRAREKRRGEMRGGKKERARDEK